MSEATKQKMSILMTIASLLVGSLQGNITFARLGEARPSPWSLGLATACG